jgi:hypothetical protein
MTNQKTPIDKAATWSVLFVPTYSQIIANIEIKGRDANIAPIIELRLETSEIITTNTEVMTIL